MDKITHFEIPFEDQERAQKFYTENFGWDISKFEGMPYWIAKTCECDENQMPKETGAINGGMYKREGKITSPVLVINVDDIDASIEKIKSSGGSIIMEKRNVGEMGIYAQFKDTEGNILGLWQMLKK